MTRTTRFPAPALAASAALAALACGTGETVAGDGGGGQSAAVAPAATDGAGGETASAAAWQRFFSRLHEAAGDASTIVGRDGWLFFAPELRHLGLERFWGPAAAEVSRASDPANADPVAAIVDFHHQLESAGIELLFVPVPAKAAIYPEHLPADPPATVSAQLRADAADRAILGLLADAGVPVLDLTPALLAAKDAGAPLYCRTDTHWSPRGIAVAAHAIADRLGGAGDRTWRVEPAPELAADEREITIDGDLRKRLAAQGQVPLPPMETLAATLIRARQPATGFPVERSSPLLLLGDSHALVFHAGADMHAEDAGLPEHLGRALSVPVDLVAVRGSGATPARVNLLRRGDGLAGKRLVVWVISVREYTEGQGWAAVPIRPP